ncbi:MAG: protein transport protein subunit gamma [Thermoplasmata archaeon]|jgi:protein transport protein SEC61 subunit gamma-like protein|nr:protein transport protein subunit gamma [Thermoplasmata archaeon]
MADEESLDDVINEETAPKPHAAHPHATGPSAGFVDKAWDVQEKLTRRWDGLGKGRIARVLRMARKPEPEEFRQSAMIVLVGIAIIGALGFFTYLFMSWLLKAITPA